MKESYSINIIGTITTDLELKTTQNGKNYVRFSVCCATTCLDSIAALNSLEKSKFTILRAVIKTP